MLCWPHSGAWQPLVSECPSLGQRLPLFKKLFYTHYLIEFPKLPREGIRWGILCLIIEMRKHRPYEGQPVAQEHTSSEWEH